VGDLGEEAYRFIDFLVAADQTIWQILPLGPTGVANSPYDSRSAFAGSPLLISENWLVHHRLLDWSDIAAPRDHVERADYVYAWQWKEPLLRRAFQRFTGDQHLAFESRFEEFQKREASWLDDFTLFQALHAENGHEPWTEW